MRFSRDLIIVIVLFALLIAFTAFGAARRAEIEQQQENITAYSTHSAQPSGTLALQMWLDAIGYRTQRIENDAFGVPADARALFIFTPREAFIDSELQVILRWVERGNTVIVVERDTLSDRSRLLRELKAKVQPIEFVEHATLEQPLAVARVQVNTDAGLNLDRADYVTYLSDGKTPLLVSWKRGQGNIVLASTTNLFTNGGLQDDGNAALMRALLNGVPRGGLIAFDEYHLGFTGKQASLQALLYNTPWGWAIIFSALVIFVYLFINGQRFGRVVPLRKELARRSPAEYVLSMAQLFRRAGKRQMVLQHYHQQLKRSLGRPYRINANLPDDEFIAELARFRDINRDALWRTLRALNQSRVGERELVKLADEAIKLRRPTTDH